MNLGSDPHSLQFLPSCLPGGEPGNLAEHDGDTLAFMFHKPHFLETRKAQGTLQIHQAGRNVRLFHTMKPDRSFYDTAAWKRTRERVLRRDRYMCVDCRRYGRMREAVEVHHIQHLEDAPELALDPGNLVSLCKACHRKRHPEKGGQHTR